MNPPVLIFKAQIFFATPKEQHVLRLKLETVCFGVEKAIDVHKAILDEDLLHVRSNLKWFSQVTY